MGIPQHQAAQQISRLIKTQRRLAASSDPLERMMGTLLVAGQLSRCLARASDRYLGRLMFRHVWNRLPLTSPEMQIAIEATRRLMQVRRRTGNG